MSEVSDNIVCQNVGFMDSSRDDPMKADEVNELLQTLSDTVRRETIYFFEDFVDDDAASIDAVVDHIDERRSGENPTELRVDLHHVHLPKLANQGWLDYDPRSGEIRYYGRDKAARILTDIRQVFQ